MAVAQTPYSIFWSRDDRYPVTQGHTLYSEALQSTVLQFVKTSNSIY